VCGRVIEYIKEKMMLKIIGSVSLLFFSSFAFSQSGTNPPNDVRESFHRDYPKSQGGEWVNQGKGFEVKFNDRDNDNGESVAYYRSDGVHIDTHSQYDNRDIPQPVTDHMTRNYSGSDGYRVVRIDRHSAPDMYEVHYTHKKYRHKIYVDEYGKEKNYHDYHY
jgi:hypothetical protein